MGAFLFTCPTTKLKVQHWLDDDDDALENEFKGIICSACMKLHFINRRTGKLLGETKASIYMRPSCTGSMALASSISCARRHRGRRKGRGSMVIQFP